MNVVWTPLVLCYDLKGLFKTAVFCIDFPIEIILYCEIKCILELW